ncbi:MAG: DUF3422 domain-containing protein [Rhizobiales bacterium]|nr:DUF3422 domain-containing protein [Hyphomicrobiales bacterium]
MQFEPHPLRSAVLGEVHARPFSAIEAPRRVIHFAFLTDAEHAVADRTAFAAFCEARGQRGPASGAKHHRIDLADCALRWEQHAEFTTYSWGFPSADRTPFETPATIYMQRMRDLPQPGPHLVSVDLFYANERNQKNWQSAFDATSLAACRTIEGKAVAATDFHVTADGFVRILLLGNKLSPLQAGALVLQLLELETYRSLCLLGLPTAQTLQPAIRDFEQRLAAITTEMTVASGLDANRPLLARLMELAGELEAAASRAQFRFGATWAYYQIVRARIEDLKEVPVSGLQTLSGFMERRLAPAVRTCTSVEDRQEKLSDKLSRAANLLRTRVDIELEEQNADLLRGMNERTKMQLRLQQTVEGLSIAAITYYVAQLVFYASGPFGLEDRPAGKWFKAGTVIVCALIVATIVRRVRRKNGPG